MILSHKIRLLPTPAQEEYFRRACGTARFVWNAALAEWNRQYENGETPSVQALKKSWNAGKYTAFPWLKDIHRDAHSQPFVNLGKAWGTFFADVKAGRKAHAPRFKKKGRATDSFYVANDMFRCDGKTVVLPRIGRVAMAESLRITGKIMSGTVSRTADRWFLSVQVEVSDADFHRNRSANGVEGVDLGVKAAATLASGEAIAGPKPLKAALRRLKMRGRAVSRKERGSRSKRRAVAHLAKIHMRISSIRKDFCHKLTTRLCSENQALGIEDLHVAGMVKNHCLARAISDIGFGMLRQQLEYKSKRYGTDLLVADRFYPSSRLCSACGWKNEALTLKQREWTYLQCAVTNDRDQNAAQNLKALAAAGRPTRGEPAMASGKSRQADTISPLGDAGLESIKCTLMARLRKQDDRRGPGAIPT